MDYGAASLIWTCPRCGLVVIVEGPADAAVDLWLCRVDWHLEVCGVWTPGTVEA